MKKVIKNRLSGTKKFFSKVLSKSSVSTNESNIDLEELEAQQIMESCFAQELEALKEQITNLKAAVATLQNDTDRKEVALAKMAREKEKLSQELNKQKRTNNNLVKQLEDERKFYYQEKEVYCQEMNELKKLKQVLSTTSMGPSDEKTLLEFKTEISKLKLTLNQTLEANYNLSIKFLRMKNTKTCMKTELKKMKLDHDKLVNDLKTKIENLSEEINTLIQEKLSTVTTPSSKKYLQLVKQNSCLVYENLCLQLEVDKLNLKFEKIRLQQTKTETNSRLKYLHSQRSLPTSSSSSHQQQSFGFQQQQQPQSIFKNLNSQRKPNEVKKHVRINTDAPEKLEKEPQPCCSHYQQQQQHQNDEDKRITKIFERTNLPGNPTIQFSGDYEIQGNNEGGVVKTMRSSGDGDKNSSKLPKQNVTGRVQSETEIASKQS